MPLRVEERAPWRERVAQAVADRDLWRKVEGNTSKFVRAKAAAYGALPDPEALRDAAHRIKADVVTRLPELIDQLERRVTARGGRVHRAAGAEDAVRIVAEIAQRRGVRLAVKSKSMVSEEIGLNRGLAQAGVEAVETDLGEYIVQLAGDAPSHLVAPLMHRSKADCAEILGVPGEADTGRLCALARATLREKFLAAGMGVTGGNFLIAETGTLVLVTNEGNGRMVTSAPPVHVAVVGVEKVLPRLADLPTFIDLLPRAATGQKITVYVSMVSGPRGDGEADGPDEFHLVLVDNGRLAMRRTRYADALACLRCGACLNVCPVYRQVGGHAYASPYAGPIGVVVTPLLGSLAQSAELTNFCSMCGACSDACPVEIPLHQHIRSLRADKVEGGYEPAGLRRFFGLWAWLWSSPWRYRAFYRLARALQGPLVRSRPARAAAAWEGADAEGADAEGGDAEGGAATLGWAPPPLSGWLRTRDLPPIAARTFRERWAARGKESKGGTGLDPAPGGT